jgi:hypothetical protein
VPGTNFRGALRKRCQSPFFLQVVRPLPVVPGTNFRGALRSLREWCQHHFLQCAAAAPRVVPGTIFCSVLRPLRVVPGTDFTGALRPLPEWCQAPIFVVRCGRSLVVPGTNFTGALRPFREWCHHAQVRGTKFYAGVASGPRLRRGPWGAMPGTNFTGALRKRCQSPFFLQVVPGTNFRHQFSQRVAAAPRVVPSRTSAWHHLGDGRYTGLTTRQFPPGKARYLR